MKLLKKIPWWGLWLYWLTFMSSVIIADWCANGSVLKDGLVNFALDVAVLAITLDQWCENVWRSRKVYIMFVSVRKNGREENNE